MLPRAPFLHGQDPQRNIVLHRKRAVSAPYPLRSLSTTLWQLARRYEQCPARLYAQIVIDVIGSGC